MIVGRKIVSLRGGIDVDVKAAGSVVRWTRRSSAEQQQQQQREREEEGVGGRCEGGVGADESPAGSTNSNSSGTTITFLSDETDDPPVTRSMTTCDDGEPFRRPGRYTFIVSSGPLTVGRLFVPEISRTRRRNPRPAEAKISSSEPSSCGDDSERAGTDEGCGGNSTAAAAVVMVDANNDVDHSLAAAAAEPSGSPEAPPTPEEALAAAGATRAFVPPPENNGEDKQPEGGCSVEESLKVGAQRRMYVALSFVARTIWSTRYSFRASRSED